MKFGLTPKEYSYINQNVVEPLRALGAEVYVYGSRARGDHQKYSDLDLMIEASTDLSSLISEIQEKLSNSNFPYKLDIVEFHDYAESYKPSYYKDRVRY
jgi:uncharacterized protein